MARETISHPAEQDAAHDTIHHGPVETAQPTKAKVCIICGANVAGQRRYKDGAGRYYCEDCFTAQTSGEVADNDGVVAAASLPTPPPTTKKKRLATCPDCKGEFAPDVLIDFAGAKICEKCLRHREQAAKREAARIAAAEEEARRQEQRKQLWIKISIAAVAVMALYGIIMLLMG